MFDAALANVRIVDPANGVDTHANIAVQDGKIAEITQESLKDRVRDSDVIKGVNGRGAAEYGKSNRGRDAIAAAKGTMTILMA